jgi:signal transduction histidine kinase
MLSSVPRRAFLLDGVMAVIVTVFCIVIGFRIADQSDEPFGASAIVTTAIVGGSIAFRRFAPEVVLGVIIVGLTIYTVAGFAGGPIFLAPTVPLYTIASIGNRRRMIRALVATAVSFVAIAAIADDRGEHLVFMLAFIGWVGGAVFLGAAQHSRRAYLAQLEQRARDLEESRDEEARRRVAEERLRIARDLHDVIAHGIAAIHLQSSVALHVLERQPTQAQPALQNVKQLSKQTLSELRSTLDVLRADGDDTAPLAPTPGLDRLAALVAITRDAGLEVELHVAGEGIAVPLATDVAAYRIVQESLTNVMRHAGEHARATVTVSRGSEGVEVEIVDDGLGAAAADSSGHGLAGMSERAASLGGAVVAGARPGGGFRVHAFLPFAAAADGRPE